MGRRNPFVTSSQILKGSRFQSHAALNAVIRTCATARESALLKSNHSLGQKQKKSVCHFKPDSQGIQIPKPCGAKCGNKNVCDGKGKCVVKKQAFSCGR